MIISELERNPADAYKQGLAVIELSSADPSVTQMLGDLAVFASTVWKREAIASAETTGLPIGIEAKSDEDLAMAGMFGQFFVGCLENLVDVSGLELIRSRFLFYRKAGDSTPVHMDDPLDDDHELTVGLSMTGLGKLETVSYTGKQGEQIPIDLFPGSLIAQKAQTRIQHRVESVSAERTSVIWDFARNMTR